MVTVSSGHCPPAEEGMTGKIEEETMAPPWLVPLLATPFFYPCAIHGDSTRCECNFFCLDCPSACAFCFSCRARSHFDHRVIQIRRSSYHDVVRVSEVQKALDISGVQTYVINSARVVFLNERPQPRATATAASASAASSSKQAAHACHVCSRALLDPFRFCSLGCKLEGIRRGVDALFTQRRENAGDGARAPDLQQSQQGSTKAARPGGGPAAPPTSRHRRKGIPRRAALPS